MSFINSDLEGAKFYFNKYSKYHGAFFKQLIIYNNYKNIVEIGVAHGFSTKYLCEAAAETGGIVNGFDCWEIHGQKNQFLPFSTKENVEEYLKELPVKLYKINTKTKGFENIINSLDKIDFAFIDGDHSYDGIKNDFEIIYPCLSDFGIIAFHDTLVIDGCREFIIDLRTKYNDGTFDIVDFPCDKLEHGVGISLLVKRTYTNSNIKKKIIEICGSPSTPDEIYNKEINWYQKETRFNKAINKYFLKNIKFYIGPMSKNIVDSISKFSVDNNYNFGIIPSRRQIDYNGGYVNNWTTETFKNYLNNNKNLIIERDHGGIGQGENYDNGILSFYNDANYFYMIHVDPWKIYKNNYEKGIQETVDIIKFITEINPNCLFEVGTEESICYFSEEQLYNFLFSLKEKLGQLFNNIAYCVIQSGTKLQGTKNIGKFDSNRLKNMVKICEEFGILSKEHNGDYLKLEDIKYRFDLGLSAINIAPEFGVFETDIILENINDEQKEKFFNICYNSKKWEKWVNNDFDPYKNKTELIRICGHYQFSTKEFKELNLDLDNIIKEKLYNKLKIISEL